MRFHLPNFLTCCNLLCGCITAVLIFDNEIETASVLIFIAVFFDMLDGMAARKLGGNTDFGKQLDSLADIVSFGFVPGALMHKLFLSSEPAYYFGSGILVETLQFFPFIITIFSALRLAKFNVDSRQTDSFIGLPTPANALFFISLPFVVSRFHEPLHDILINPFTILLLSALSAASLVSGLRLFSLKFKTTAFSDNLYQYLLIIATLILFPFLLFAAIPFLVILYILLSLIQNALKKKQL